MNPYGIIAGLVASIVLSVSSYNLGWDKRGDREATIALKAKEKADAEKQVERARAERLATDLENEKRNFKTVTIETIKEIPKVTTVYVERPGDEPKPIPPAVITFGAVGLYNYSLTGVRKATSKPVDPTGGTDITRANVGLEDILKIHAENAGKWAECRAQLNKLIDFELGKPTQE